MDAIEWGSGLPADGPYCQVFAHPDGGWGYRWWDEADHFVVGEPPARSKHFRGMGGVLAALLADSGRCGRIDDRQTIWDELPDASIEATAGRASSAAEMDADAPGDDRSW